MPTFADAWPALTLLVAILMLPWGVSWMKRQGWGGVTPDSEPIRVVSVLAVGPQQKVVTVALDLGTHRKWLVLGVTPQSITKLDSLDCPTQPSSKDPSNVRPQS